MAGGCEDPLSLRRCCLLARRYPPGLGWLPGALALYSMENREGDRLR